MFNTASFFLTLKKKIRRASLAQWVHWCDLSDITLDYQTVWSLSCPTEMIQWAAFDGQNTVTITHHWPGFGSFWGACPADWIERIYRFPLPQKTAIQSFFNRIQEPFLKLNQAIEAQWNPAFSKKSQKSPWEPWVKGCIGSVGEEISSRSLVPHLRHLEMKEVDAWSLQAFLSHCLRIAVSLQTFQGLWQSIPESVQTTLGITERPLGRGLALGSRVWMQHGGLRVCLHVSSLQMYQQLSHEEGFFRSVLLQALKARVPLGTAIQIQWEVSLSWKEKPSACLGEPIWLGENKADRWIKQEEWMTP